MPSKRPVRVLHVLGSLGHGGIETWLMHIFRKMDPASVRHEVILTKAEPGVYEEEALQLGVQVHRPVHQGGRLDLLKRLDALLRGASYDVVHSHMYMFSGLVLGVAARRGVPLRIAHCHHAAMTQDGGGAFDRLQHRLLKVLISRSATLKLGISESAIEEIAGSDWRRDENARILLYGFDFSRYDGAGDRGAQVREELGIGAGSQIVGHVGRFVPEKNHTFLLQTFAEVARRRPSARLVLVGAGPLQAEAEALVRTLGIEGSVLFAGTTQDVPAYMSMFDLFVLTSTSEGLGIVALETQAAGTAAVLSDVVPGEVDILPQIIDRVPLSAGPAHWAERIEAQLASPRSKDTQSWRALQASSFGIDRCLSELRAIYAGDG